MKKLLPVLALISLIIASCSSSKPLTQVPKDPTANEELYSKTISLGRGKWVKFADIELVKGNKYIFSLRPQSTRPFGIRYTLQIQKDGAVIREIASRDGDLSSEMFSPAETSAYHLVITYDQKFSGPESTYVNAFKGTAMVIKFNRKW